MKKSENVRESNGQTTLTMKPNTDGISAPASLRRLKWDEVVTRGDFIGDERHGFEPWEGPTGFRADAFQMPIYRRDKTSPVASKKSKTTGSLQSAAKIERGN